MQETHPLFKRRTLRKNLISQGGSEDQHAGRVKGPMGRRSAKTSEGNEKTDSPPAGRMHQPGVYGTGGPGRSQDAAPSGSAAASECAAAPASIGFAAAKRNPRNAGDCRPEAACQSPGGMSFKVRRLRPKHKQRNSFRGGRQIPSRN